MLTGYGNKMDFMTVKKIASDAVDSHKLINQLVSQIKAHIDDNKITGPGVCDILFLLESIISYDQDVETSYIHKVLDSVCLSLLGKIHPSIDSRVENLAVLTSVSSLCGTCLLKADEVRAVTLIEQCLGLLKSYSHDSEWPSEEEGVMDIYCCLSVLQHISKQSRNKPLPTVQSKLLLGYFIIAQAMKYMKNNLLINMTMNCLQTIISLSSDGKLSRLTAVWELIIEEFDAGNEKPYVLLCGMANHFFPVINNNVVLDLKTKDAFWRILQRGISKTTPSSRKQSMYLLKRITDICNTCGVSVQSEHLFQWGPSGDYLEIWDDYILLLETLEERQVHIIKPVLPRLSKLIKATHIKQNGQGTLHTSWLIALFKRFLMHESIFVVRWATNTVLTLDLDLCPMLKQDEDKYFCRDFLISIQEPKLFIRPEGAPAGTCPSCGEALTGFFRNCWEVLATSVAKTAFFRNILTTIISHTWSPVPLQFIFEALSKIPATPILDSAGLQDLKNGVSSNMRTWDGFTRGTVQCFCGQILLNLINTETTQPMDLFSTLTMFAKTESLCRRTSFWKEVVDWLKMVTKKGIKTWTSDDIKSLIKNQITRHLAVKDGGESVLDETDILMTVRLVLLSVDADILPMKPGDDQETYSLTHCLQALTHLINDFPSHPYMPVIKVERALQLLTGLVTEVGEDSTDDDLSQFIKRSLVDSAAAIVVFIQQRLAEGWRQTSDLLSLRLCCDALSLVVSGSCDSNAREGVRNLSQRCLQYLQTLKQDSSGNQIRRLGASTVLGTITNHATDQTLVHGLLTLIQSASSFIPATFTKPPSDDGISQKEWGALASDFMTSQWKTVYFYLQNTKPSDSFINVEKCLDYLAVSAGEATLILFSCIKILLPMKIVEGKSDTVVEVLRLAWNYLLEHQGKGTSYWAYLEGYADMAFQRVLMTQPKESAITQKLLEIAGELLLAGEEKSGVVNVLLKRLLTDCPLPMENFLSVVVQCCMFGPIYKKQDKLLIDVFSYVSSLGSRLAVNQLNPWQPKNLMLRVWLVEFVCRLDPQNSLHHSFGNCFLSSLFEKYQELVQISTGNIFINSLAHRQKNRLMQFALLLEPFISQADSERVFELCLEFLGLEMQPSVRHYQEWMCMRLLSRFPGLVAKLWPAFEKLRKTSTAGLCSLLHIVVHTGPLQPTKSQEVFYDSALNKVLSLSMAHHFHTRIHALAVLSLLWDQCKTLGLQAILNRHSIIHACFSFFDEDNNSAKNVKKLLENYFLNVLDLHRDYSLETLFHTLPRLSLLNDDEWIAPHYFSAYPKACYIPLLNPDPSLAKCEERTRHLRVQNEAESEEAVGDIQKKIMPWRLMNPDDEVVEELEYAKRQHKSNGLILVTSLIDKVPNLGGLCRTSEIFGVSEFVINKLRYVEDKVFQSLSVTAHKWVPIREVYEACLPEYLQHKKSQGYTLVGVEQTANSVSLNDFRFPTKTLLLLGNEKEGIPADLISLLDVCVEIPQQGVIRSLNVHVSGAILVWEYRRQQMMAGKTEVSGR